MRKTQKKLTTKKPKVKNQKTGKKPKIRNSLKYKGKIKKEKLITISKELICIKEENNTQSNSSCQKECIHFESHKKKDLDNSSELEKGSEEMDIKIIIFENKNPDPDPEEPGKIILIKKRLNMVLADIEMCLDNTFLIFVSDRNIIRPLTQQKTDCP